MPDFNKKGPLGAGPGTGRGFGPCGGGLGWRRKLGTGRGLGKCFGWMWPQGKKEKVQMLKEYKGALKEELDDVEKEEKELNK